jgi:hypothetical protein
MKKNVAFIAAVLCAAILLQGCAYVSFSYQPVPGYIFSDVHGPGNISSASVGSKEGTARAESFLGWVATGDASNHAAASNGGISTVSHTDYHAWSILGVYARFDTYAYGD